jgi:Tol biopolymer transport system component
MSAARHLAPSFLWRHYLGLVLALVTLFVSLIWLMLTLAALRKYSVLAYVEQYGESAQTRIIDIDHKFDRLIYNFTACQVAWLPDGATLLLTKTLPGETHQVFTINIANRLESAINGNGLHNEAASLSPDGEWIIFSANRSEINSLYLVRPDGSGLHKLVEIPIWVTDTRWSPDGASIAVFGMQHNRIKTVYTVNSETGAAEQLPDDLWLNWSSDSAQRAYPSQQEGSIDNFIRALVSGRESKLTNAAEHDADPVWSPDGRHIAYVSITTEGYQIEIINVENQSRSSITPAIFQDINQLVWSPDGIRIAFSARSNVALRQYNLLTPYDLYVVNATGDALTVVRRGHGAYVNNFSRFCALQWSP